MPPPAKPAAAGAAASVPPPLLGAPPRPTRRPSGSRTPPGRILSATAGAVDWLTAGTLPKFPHVHPADVVRVPLVKSMPAAPAARRTPLNSRVIVVGSLTDCLLSCGSPTPPSGSPTAADPAHWAFTPTSAGGLHPNAAFSSVVALAEFDHAAPRDEVPSNKIPGMSWQAQPLHYAPLLPTRKLWRGKHVHIVTMGYNRPHKEKKMTQLKQRGNQNKKTNEKERTKEQDRNIYPDKSVRRGPGIIPNMCSDTVVCASCVVFPSAFIYSFFFE